MQDPGNDVTDNTRAILQRAEQEAALNDLVHADRVDAVKGSEPSDHHRRGACKSAVSDDVTLGQIRQRHQQNMKLMKRYRDQHIHHLAANYAENAACSAMARIEQSVIHAKEARKNPRGQGRRRRGNVLEASKHRARRANVSPMGAFGLAELVQSAHASNATKHEQLCEALQYHVHWQEAFCHQRVAILKRDIAEKSLQAAKELYRDSETEFELAYGRKFLLDTKKQQASRLLGKLGRGKRAVAKGMKVAASASSHSELADAGKHKLSGSLAVAGSFAHALENIGKDLVGVARPQSAPEPRKKSALKLKKAVRRQQALVLPSRVQLHRLHVKHGHTFHG